MSVAGEDIEGTGIALPTNTGQVRSIDRIIPLPETSKNATIEC